MSSRLQFFIAFLMIAGSISGCQDKSPKGQNGDDSELSEQEVQETFSQVKADTLPVTSVPKYVARSSTASDTSSTKAVENITTQRVRVLETPMSAGCVMPNSIRELNGGMSLKIYKFDQKMAASATAMGFTGNIGKNEMVFIQDYVRYTMRECNGSRQKVGIGLRCFIHVISFKGKIGYATLPGIAANVELQKARASYELTSLGFGIDGRTIASTLDTSGDYNVENFGKLAVAFNKVLETLNSDNEMEIKPAVLP